MFNTTMGMATRKLITVVSLLPMFNFMLFLVRCCCAVYNVSSTNPLSKGQTLCSPKEIFVLGFFSFDNSQNLYLGIWYKNINPQVVVWVANRVKPVTTSTVSLTIGGDGDLILLDGKQDIVWSSNKNSSSDKSFAELLDSGNLVLKDLASGRVLWESFAHLSHVLLPNNTLTYNFKIRQNRFLTSWKSETDPSPGNYASGIAPQVPPQIFIWKELKPYWRSGPWSKQKFIGIPEMDVSYDSAFRVDTDTEQGLGYYSYTSSIEYLSYIEITPEGIVKIKWNMDRGWELNWETPNSTSCEIYGACGPNGVCIRSERPKCKCLRGFEQKSAKGNWIDGCVRKKELSCNKNSSNVSAEGNKTDKFDQMVKMKVPDLHEYVNGVGANGCRQACLNNCSCSAYTFVDGIGCLIWKGELLDMVQFPSNGEDIFIRLAPSEFGEEKRVKLLIISLTSISLIAIISVGMYIFCRRKQQERTQGNSQEHKWRKDLKEGDIADLHFFDIHTILNATDNFTMSNKLGQGGFGPGYKGKLENGTEIAIKRLSSSSGQGTEEFKNEIILVSKLRHRNLVRLLGCCVEKEEKILIYEFMVNKSLDTFLFDSTRKSELDWAKRFNIIQGIARGLLYLHRDSCLRVIHRDLKVSNILLDEKLNPKISDFGLARMFEGTEDLANTHRVVGTLGYMSPEYVMGGSFSEKSDVFSFGILMLEIITGRKASSFIYDDQSQSEGYLAYVWQSWCENKGLNLVDQALFDMYSMAEARRCVQIALLCVQDHAIDRPNMVQVVSMLNSEIELSSPTQPTFAFQNRRSRDVKPHADASNALCDFTESLVHGR